MIRHILVLILLLLPTDLLAATYYCDNTATGNNDGTSWTDAWTDLVNAVTMLSAGDTLYISGGSTSKTYSISAQLEPSSGTSGNLVTIKTGQDSGHNGTVIIDGGDTVETIWYVRNSDYVTISGNVNGERHMTVQNWGGAGSESYSYAFNGYGGIIAGVTVDHVNVINDDITCPISDCSTRPEFKVGFYYTRAEDGTAITNNYIDGCIKATITMNYNDTVPGYDQLFVQNNIVKGYKNDLGYGGPDFIAGARGVTISGNTVYYEIATDAEYDPTHAAEDGVQIIGYADEDGPVYTKVYNNVIIGISNAFIRVDALLNGTTGLYRDVDEIQIYNNLMYVNDTFGLPRGIEWDGRNGSNVNIYNNTLVGFSNYTGIHISKNDGDDVAINIENNILVDSKINISYTSGDVDELNVDNNLIILSDGQYGDYRYTDKGDYSYVFLTQTNDPYDSELDFDFVDSENNDYRLASTATMAIGTGADLSAIFTTDITGATRSVPWDLGVYKYRVIGSATNGTGSGRATNGIGGGFAIH